MVAKIAGVVQMAHDRGFGRAAWFAGLRVLHPPLFQDLLTDRAQIGNALRRKEAPHNDISLCLPLFTQAQVRKVSTHQVISRSGSGLICVRKCILNCVIFQIRNTTIWNINSRFTVKRSINAYKRSINAYLTLADYTGDQAVIRDYLKIGCGSSNSFSTSGATQRV
jgi:hypothetical protein